MCNLLPLMCCLWFADTYVRHGKMHDMLAEIMARCTICCLVFASICVGNGKTQGLLPLICWCLC